MKYCALLVVGGLLLSGPPFVYASELDQAELQRNPFERSRRPRVTQPAGQAPIIETAEEVVLQLRATLVSGSERLANINGTILAPGERILGYRLLRVEEGQVVLVKNGREVLISMYEAR